ncbi:serine/threonine-protein kinase [Chengkuizengella axinellae]|uniref:non-specific serine/threonine protein kinase n=1 Tax=Chengkuizengella axinellae TaxID=3064388 RepID=A0ABT9IXX5_9BACL|nr:serine/threonine-protein kinase [Chengkuizengella sp. 2205SS18-9]MDP5274093.1 serine/threonine-protein kinase [Chengkuizengella sp. 2205SS18-9]
MVDYNTFLKQKDCLGNRYQIESIIGQGGMGAVYLAKDLKLKGKRWAIKQTKSQTNSVVNFQQEAETLIQLNHPYLPNIIDFFPPNDKGNTYIVMDYIQGGNLAQIFEKEGNNLPFEKVIKYAIQICELLYYLHHHPQAPIIYRDLKPSNVMIDNQDNVRLIDFGISRRFEHSKQQDTVHLGTVGFAAPEQFEGKQTDHRTDLFHLGAMLYYFLTNGHYYTSNKPLHQFKNIPNTMIQVIQKLLQVKPENRYQDALLVKKDLGKIEGLERVSTEINVNTGGNHHFQYKVILVGSMYGGAGATFTSVALARAFHEMKIKNALVEYPTNVPELYSLLFGDKNKPNDYEFLMNQLNSSNSNLKHGNKIEWDSGNTVWYPLPTSSYTLLEESWSESEIFPLLFQVRKPITIIDISNRWDHQSIQQLCKSADEICFIVDSIPTKFCSATSQLNLNIAMELKQAGKNVHFIVNRSLNSKIRKKWDEILPWSPSCYLPNLPYELVQEYIWKGKLIQDERESREKLRAGLYPFIKQIVPKKMMIKQNNPLDKLKKYLHI